MSYSDQQPPEARPINPQGMPPYEMPPGGGGPPGVPPHYRPPSPSDGVVLGLAIAGLVVGVLSFAFAMITCIGMYAVYPAAMAIILSTVAIFIAYGQKANYGPMAIAALVVSLAALGKGMIEWKRTKDTLQEGGKVLKKVGEDISNDFKKANELQRQRNKKR